MSRIPQVSDDLDSKLLKLIRIVSVNLNGSHGELWFLPRIKTDSHEIVQSTESDVNNNQSNVKSLTFCYHGI